MTYDHFNWSVNIKSKGKYMWYYFQENVKDSILCQQKNIFLSFFLPLTFISHLQ